MDKRFALVAVWLVFAAAAVGVGFGAAGLVGEPFERVTGSAGDRLPVVDDVGEPAASQSAEDDPAATPTPTKTASPAGSTGPARGVDEPTASARPRTTGVRSADSGSTPTRRSSSPRPRASRTGGGSSAPEAPTAQTRTLSTRGGLVSATCRGSALEVGASPAVGWEIAEVEREDDGEQKVRFEPVDGDGRVEVRVRCAGGAPVFSVEDEPDDDSSGSGGGDD